jgi:WD40 repeat protein
MVEASPSGKFVGSVSGGGAGPSLSLWDGRRGRLRPDTPGVSAANLMSLALADDGHSLAAGATDGTLQLWDGPRGLLRRSLRWQGIALNRVAFAPTVNWRWPPARAWFTGS